MSMHAMLNEDDNGASSGGAIIEAIPEYYSSMVYHRHENIVVAAL